VKPSIRVVACVVAFLLAACDASNPASRTSTPPTSTSTTSAVPAHTLPTSGLLASVDWSGGLCANVEVCKSGFSVDAAGVWSKRSGGRMTSGHLTQDDLAALREALLATTLDSAPDFKGRCPTAYDGQEATYGFVRDSVKYSVASCTKEVPSNDPLAAVLGRLFDSSK
jgi:hypothetical protein